MVALRIRDYSLEGWPVLAKIVPVDRKIASFEMLQDQPVPSMIDREPCGCLYVTCDNQVVRVAANARSDEKTGASWYVTRVELPDNESEQS